MDLELWAGKRLKAWRRTGLSMTFHEDGLLLAESVDICIKSTLRILYEWRATRTR